MIKLLRALSVLTFAFLFALNADLKAADQTGYGTPAGTLVVPDGLSAQEVQKCVVEAAAGRGWRVTTRDDEKVVVVLEQEKWVAKITMPYTAKEVQLYSNSTKSGKPKLPEGWLKFLKQDINVKLNTLAVSKHP